MNCSRSLAALTLLFVGAGMMAGCSSSTGANTPTTGTSSPDGPGATGTTGTPSAPISGTPSAPTTDQSREQRWNAMSPEQQAASVLMVHYPGTDAQAIAEFVEQIEPGGLILMGDNIPEDETQLADSIASWNEVSPLPLIVGIDEEGGTVQRLDLDTFPAAPDLRDGDPAATESAFRSRAELLSGLSINTNFGIIADVTDDSTSFIWPRVLGSTPDSAAQQVEAAVIGESGLVYSTLKHFPGHGLSAADSHVSIPSSGVSFEEWKQLAAPPFEAGIENGAEMVMVGHLLFPEIAAEPASLSPRWHQILREDLGFDGIIVTDAMEMLQGSELPEYADPVANAVQTLNAGSTLVLTASGTSAADTQVLVDGIADAVRSGELDPEVLKDAGLRLMEMREGL